MAPIKFEEQIKAKLEGRNITPSDSVWSKLSDQLEVEEKKKNKTVFWWFGIAASIAALVMISINYFNTDSENNVMPVMVKEEPVIENSEPLTKDFKSEVKEELAVEEVEQDDEVLKSPESVKNDRLQPKKFALPQGTENTSIAETKIEEPISILIEEKKTDILIDKAHIDNTISKIVKLESDKNREVTDSQIDSLLKSAQREILRDRIFKDNTDVVDAKSLLQDVEEDLGLSFRTKVFEALKDNYEKVKTAVANRNN